MGKPCPWFKGAKVRLKNCDFKPGNTEVPLPLKAGQVGKITEILNSDKRYIRVNKSTGLYHWTMFELADPK